MMKPHRKPTVFAALSLALALLPAATARAQDRLVGVGHGSYPALSSSSVLRFSYVVFDAGNGAAQGLAVWRGPNSTTVWSVTSVMFLPGTRTQAFAGPIVATYGTPPPGHVVGATVFTASKDNGAGTPDETASLSVAPTLSSPLIQQLLQAFPQLAAQIGNLTTVQQLAVLLPYTPPPQFAPLLQGNIWIAP